jgi:hypothetical protein
MLDYRVVFETCELGHFPKESLSIVLAPSSTMFLCAYYSLRNLGIDIVKA